MRFLNAAILAGILLLGQPRYTAGHRKPAAKAFLLENTASRQWCAYTKKSTWKAAVHSVGAMTVGALVFSNDNLRQIYLTETDGPGDWTAYDHYFLEGRGTIVKLARIINVLPGDRSVLETYAVRDGTAKTIATTVRRLGAGKPLASPKPVWLPDLPVAAKTRAFPFSGLLTRQGLRTASEACVQMPEER